MNKNVFQHSVLGQQVACAVRTIQRLRVVRTAHATRALACTENMAGLGGAS